MLGREAVVDPTNVATPFARAHLGLPQTYVGRLGTPLRLELDSATVPSDISFNAGDFTTFMPGIYLVVATIRFDSLSATGVRSVRISVLEEGVGIADTIAQVTHGTASGGAAQIQAAGFFTAAEQKAVVIQARQTSGANLDVVATDPTDTTFAVVRVA